MPEFILKKFVSDGLKYQKPIIFTKNEFGPQVKTHDWQSRLEELPHDNVVRNGKLNLHKSHYKYFGGYYSFDLCDPENRKAKQQPGARIEKKIVNLYNFKSSTSTSIGDVCTQEDLKNQKLLKNHYLTETQKSFKRNFVPKSLKEDLQFEMTNRKIKTYFPQMSSCKFHDDDFKYTTNFLQSVKKADRFKSYNFCLGRYTDGSAYEEPKRQCFEIKYN